MIRIVFTPTFHKDVKYLAKKYRHIKSDLAPFIEQLQAGEVVGDRIPNTDYVVYKVRLSNSDIGKGKSSGYRIIYQIAAPDQRNLLKIYVKVDYTDISPDEINHLIEDIIEDITEAENGDEEPNGNG